MPTTWTPRQHWLRTIGIASLAVLIVDIVLLNLVGEASDDWWLLLVGFGIFVVGAIAIVSLLLLAVDRARQP